MAGAKGNQAQRVRVLLPESSRMGSEEMLLGEYLFADAEGMADWTRWIVSSRLIIGEYAVGCADIKLDCFVSVLRGK